MAKLEHDISRLSATLGRRRHRIKLQKQVLREGAMELCKQPRTLVTAAVSGAVLERALVDARTGQPSSAGAASAPGWRCLRPSNALFWPCSSFDKEYNQPALAGQQQTVH